MANARKLPSGRWRVLLFCGFDDNGKRIYKSFTADTKKQAEAAAATYAVQKKHEQSGEMTVGEAIDKYIQSKENVLSPATIGGYRVIRRNQMPGLMNVQLNQISNVLIQTEFNRMALTLSPKTLRNAHGLLSAALGVYLPDFTLRTSLPAKKHRVLDLPTPAEVIAAVRGTEIELPCLMALWLSLRMSEVRGIRYKDITGNILTIHNVKIKFGSNEFTKDQTKTYNSTRIHELPDYLLTLIGTGEPEAYVVPMVAQTITKTLKRLVKKSCGKDVTFHQLRHLNASVMVELGVPDKYAMERGGWSTDSTLRSVYQHTFDDKRREIDRQINEYFEKLL